VTDSSRIAPQQQEGDQLPDALIWVHNESGNLDVETLTSFILPVLCPLLPAVPALWLLHFVHGFSFECHDPVISAVACADWRAGALDRHDCKPIAVLGVNGNRKRWALTRSFVLSANVPIRFCHFEIFLKFT